MNNEEYLINNFVDIYLEESINDSSLYLKILDNQINFYKEELQFLENTKPLFFQKKKLKIHEDIMASYEQKITNAYKEMNKETQNIEKYKKMRKDVTL